MDTYEDLFVTYDLKYFVTTVNSVNYYLVKHFGEARPYDAPFI